ncbi:MAG: nucleotidyltransferase domain-containing protein [Sedimentisphaerales bacterium]|nr:nucleotidyltransferase domain-containing protein [Sedimentisphaerales bacterium]
MATALELKGTGWSSYLANARRPGAPELTEAQSEARQRLLERVGQAARALRERFGAGRVILFGSLAHAGWFEPGGDVDLAVEGLAPDDYWQAWGLAEEIIGERPVDLVEVEKATESLRRAIDRHGVEL